MCGGGGRKDKGVEIRIDLGMPKKSIIKGRLRSALDFAKHCQPRGFVRLFLHGRVGVRCSLLLVVFWSWI